LFEVVAFLPLLRKSVLRVGELSSVKRLSDVTLTSASYRLNRVSILGSCSRPTDPSSRAGGLILLPDFVDSRFALSQRPNEVHLQLRAGFDSLAIK
jgi:hypothetical protein